MRPKKTILCIDHDSRRLSLRAFLLTIHGFAVAKAETVPDAIAILNTRLPGTVDLVICPARIPGGSVLELIGYTRTRHPGVPLLSIAGSGSTFQDESYTDRTLPANPSAASLVELVKTMVARKRGPKKLASGVFRDAAAERRVA